MILARNIAFLPQLISCEEVSLSHRIKGQTLSLKKVGIVIKALRVGDLIGKMPNIAFFRFVR
jgi:hypothetical protein